MVIWGAIWGLVLGYLTSEHHPSLGSMLGAMLGALAGLTLRQVVRTETAKLIAQARLANQASPPQNASQPRPQPGPQRAADAAVPATVRVAAPEGLTEAALASPQQAATKPPTPPRNQSVSARPPASRGGPVKTSAAPDLISQCVNAVRSWFLGGNVIVRIGVLVLFVGLAFFAKYAADNAMLPAELRIAAIGAAGIAMFVFGFRLRGRPTGRLAYALTLQGAGVAVLYLTVFAAFRLYQFLPAGAAFVMLALICVFSTAVALLQNALPLAFVGFAGAFAAPILVSTGQGDHVGLFSYYLLLGCGIVTIAAWRAWRALNLLGFFATFGLATVWGTLRYQPQHLATTEPFLLGFFLLYLTATVLYATRHSLKPQQAVDATLIFGLPIATFSLQAVLVQDVEYASAFSALGLGALYLALAWWALRRNARAAAHGPSVGMWLAECFAALGLGFVTLAVPLALDGRWTAAVWAAQGLGVYWMGMRQRRWVARWAGLVLQGLAAASFLYTLTSDQVHGLPLLNATFIGAALLAACALLLGHWARRVMEPTDSAWVRQMQQLENGLAPVLFWVGFLWWQLALSYEIGRTQVDANGVWRAVFDAPLRWHLYMLSWLGSAWLVHRWALPTRRQPWLIAGTPAWFNVPLMMSCAVVGALRLDHVLQAWGWLVWPAALVLHLSALKALDGMAPQRLWSWVHSAGLWLLVLLLGNVLLWGVQQGQLQHSAWAAVTLLLSGTLVLLGLAQPALYNATGRLRSRWPLRSFAQAYLWRAALPLALAVGLAALVLALCSDGNAHPLPYIPVLNPVDLCVALALGVCALWRLRLCRSDLSVPTWLHHGHWSGVQAGIAFIALNTVWLRATHHLAGIPWRSDALFQSFLVQAGYSILWTLLALALMVWANRRLTRSAWMAGAALLGLTVIKLFLVDLSNSGGTERIVAFMGVGVMMLIIGYFAPLPPSPSAGADPEAVPDKTTAST